MEDHQNPELADIINRVRAFNIVNPTASFVFRIIDFKKSDKSCPDCGEFHIEVDENKSWLGICGDLCTVREMCNELRDVCEDNVDEEGIVSV